MFSKLGQNKVLFEFAYLNFPTNSSFQRHRKKMGYEIEFMNNKGGGNAGGESYLTSNRRSYR